MTDAGTITRQLNECAQDVRSKAKRQEREAMDRSKESIGEATTRVKESERSRQELEEDEIPEIRVEE